MIQNTTEKSPFAITACLKVDMHMRHTKFFCHLNQEFALRRRFSAGKRHPPAGQIKSILESNKIIDQFIIITIGVRPTNPNTKYGYIQFAEEPALPKTENLHKVVTFTEKPPVEMARQFISTGEFFWNAGIFVWRLSTLRKAYRTYLPNIAKNFFTLTTETPAADLDSTYALSEAISVDFGIMEHADNVYVMEAGFEWSDVESWSSLYNTCEHDDLNNGIVSGHAFTYDTKNTLVHVPANKNVIIQGLDNYIVAADDNTILICPRDREELIVKFASDVELAELTRSLKPYKQPKVTTIHKKSDL